MPTKKTPKKKDLEKDFRYKNRKIAIAKVKVSAAESLSSIENAAATETAFVVNVDDLSFDVCQNGTDSYESILVPYKSYASPAEIAKDVIDYVPEFKK